ncbi:hypothetical protein Bhyg_11108, partial [Pseudolycoriella hygida]
MKPLCEEVRKKVLHNWHNENGISIRFLAKRLKLPHLPGRGRKSGSYDKNVDKAVEQSSPNTDR